MAPIDEIRKFVAQVERLKTPSADLDLARLMVEGPAWIRDLLTYHDAAEYVFKRDGKRYEVLQAARKKLGYLAP